MAKFHLDFTKLNGTLFLFQNELNLLFLFEKMSETSLLLTNRRKNITKKIYIKLSQILFLKSKSFKQTPKINFILKNKGISQQCCF